MEEPRLGGPPGLFDSPNWERESTGGIVQRVRVPMSNKPEQSFVMGRFQVDSLNDSDDTGPFGVDANQDPAKPTSDNLKGGVPFKKSIVGSNM